MRGKTQPRGVAEVDCMDGRLPLILIAAALLVAGCTQPAETTTDAPAETTPTATDIGSREVTGTLTVQGNASAPETNDST